MKVFGALVVAATLVMGCTTAKKKGTGKLAGSGPGAGEVSGNDSEWGDSSMADGSGSSSYGSESSSGSVAGKSTGGEGSATAEGKPNFKVTFTDGKTGELMFTAAEKDGLFMGTNGAYTLYVDNRVHKKSVSRCFLMHSGGSEIKAGKKAADVVGSKGWRNHNKKNLDPWGGLMSLKCHVGTPGNFGDNLSKSNHKATIHFMK